MYGETPKWYQSLKQLISKIEREDIPRLAAPLSFVFGVDRDRFVAFALFLYDLGEAAQAALEKFLAWRASFGVAMNPGVLTDIDGNPCPDLPIEALPFVDVITELQHNLN